MFDMVDDMKAYVYSLFERKSADYLSALVKKLGIDSEDELILS